MTYEKGHFLSLFQILEKAVLLATLENDFIPKHCALLGFC